MKRRRLYSFVMILVLFLALTSYSFTQELGQTMKSDAARQFGPYVDSDVNWHTIANGGMYCYSTHFKHAGTVGQRVNGRSKTIHMHVNSGFLLALSGVGRSCCQIPADANDDGVCNNADAIYIVNYVYKGGAVPPCLTAADANYDCNINIGDAIYIINYIFKGGGQPKCSHCM